MSRELLKRALDLIGNSSNVFYEKLAKDIDAYLAQPDPEPVAWMVSHPSWPTVFTQETYTNWTEKHTVVPLYTTPPDQSAQIAELKKDNNITHENLAWYMEKYHEHLTIIAEAAHGLGINHE